MGILTGFFQVDALLLSADRRLVETNLSGWAPLQSCAFSFVLDQAPISSFSAAQTTFGSFGALSGLSFFEAGRLSSAINSFI